ncbi:MAG: cyclic nucleotide-binding domain-containing protein [Chloroflexi bacterium]|nr:MAG: cyclic nucleotide-binding domain-containing protein [Chloroflexota bacterium]
MQGKVDRLKAVPLFSHCSKHELEFLSTRMDEVSLPAGRTLLTQGKPTDTFYVLLSGEVEVSREGRPLKRLKDGDFFGEIGMLDRGLATATVTTTEPAECLCLSHAQFRDAIKANEGLTMQVLAAMAQRLREDSAQLV